MGVCLIFGLLIVNLFLPNWNRGIVYWATDLPSEFCVEQEPRVAENLEKAGCLTFGPYREQEAGKIQVTVVYDTDIEGNWVDIYSDILKETFQKAAFNPAENEITLEAEIDEDVTDLEIRSHYEGNGYLQIEKIIVTERMEDLQMVIWIYNLIFLGVLFFSLKQVFRYKKKEYKSYEKKNIYFVILSFLVLLGINLFLPELVQRKNVYYGADLPSDFFMEKSLRVAEDLNKKGCLTYGPYKKQKAGKIKITVEYETDRENNWIDIYSDAFKEEYHVLYLNPAKEEITFELILEKEVTDLEVRSHYEGDGYLEIKKIIIEERMWEIRILVLLCNFVFLGFFASVVFCKMMDYKKDIVSAKVIIVIAILFGLECFFFRNVLCSDFMFGDRGDARFCNLITEHWYKFFSGQEKFRELAMFYPCEDALAYSDMLLGYGILYSIFRVMGGDIYFSYKFCLITIHFIGTISMYFLLNKKMKLDMEWTFFGIIAFSYSNTYSFKIGHTQLITLSLIPLLLILLFTFYENLENRKKRNCYAILTISFFAFIMYTAWYTAFFTALFSFIWFIIYIIINKKNQTDFVESFFHFLKQNLKDIFIYFLYMIVILIPFIYLYIPVLRQSGERKWEEISGLLPEIIDFFNVTKNNWLFGDFFGKMQLEKRGFSSELCEGFSLIFWLAFVMSFFILRRMIGTIKEKKRKKEILFYSSIFYSIVVSMVLILKLSSNGLSLWMIIYKWIPGAGSIRAVVRYLFFLTLPSSIIVAAIGDRYCKNKNKTERGYWSKIFVLLILLFASNIYKGGVSAEWNILQERLFLSSIQEPPEECKIFYIIDSSKQNNPPYIYQLDAFEIASKFSIKTLNGYSGQSPVNWQGLWEVNADDYEKYVWDWIQENHLSDVYSYDIASNTWKK